MSTEPAWLNDEEQRVWRLWLLSHQHLLAELNRGLQAESDLSGADYVVLVNLTEVSDGGLRMRDLASSLDWERSRLSHQVKRMEARDLVQRAECKEDARGQLVTITDSGRAAIEQAAPHHVEMVRRFMIDQLQPSELRQLGQMMDKMMAAMDRAEPWGQSRSASTSNRAE